MMILKVSSSLMARSSKPTRYLQFALMMVAVFACVSLVTSDATAKATATSKADAKAPASHQRVVIEKITRVEGITESACRMALKCCFSPTSPSLR